MFPDFRLIVETRDRSLRLDTSRIVAFRQATMTATGPYAYVLYVSGMEDPIIAPIELNPELHTDLHWLFPLPTPKQLTDGAPHVE